MSRRRAARVRERHAAYQPALLGPLYCDSSALLKLYFREPESARFTRVVGARDDLVISDLAITEITSALARRAREGAMTAEAAQRTYRAIVESLDASPYHRVELTREAHRRAEQLLLESRIAPLRAADALHVALALSARAASMAVFDARLAAAARAAGFTVYPG